MKKLLSAATICCLAIGLSATPALANNAKPFKAKLLRSSQVLGSDLYNNSGENIGQIRDVVFDENSGGMTRAILAIGDYIGTGDQLTPLEWNKIETQSVDNDHFKFIVKADKAELKTEKSFAQDKWPDFEKGWASEMPATSGHKLVRMSQANDAKLFDQTGHQIGGIKDIMLDTHSGKVAYAVVSFNDDFINKGDQLTMVPWMLVRQSKEATPGYVLHADKTKLEGATFFAPDAWPDMHDVTWNKHVYDYYTVTPYYWTGV